MYSYIIFKYTRGSPVVMKGALLFLLALLLLPGALATLEQQVVDVRLHDNNIVEERITLLISSDTTYDEVGYLVGRRPLAVIFNGTHTEEEAPNGSMLVFNRTIPPGRNNISFTLLFDDLITREGASRAFSILLRPMDKAALDVSVTLPQGLYLAETEAAVSPRPDSINSDGRQITLRWHRQGIEELPIIVLYEGASLLWPTLITGGILLALIILFVVLRRRYRRVGKRVLRDSLDQDERLIVSLLERNVHMQKALCAESGFSKSKMSKVVRKLEEKGVVRKEPFFKTNKLELTRGWK